MEKKEKQISFPFASQLTAQYGTKGDTLLKSPRKAAG